MSDARGGASMDAAAAEVRALAAERVVLVDADDREVGTASKWEAHADGRLHRAVSVLVFDASTRLLLQRRADHKYHSPGLWSNTCCGHPRPGESTLAAARRRLREEMGLRCRLRPAFRFRYRVTLEGALVEHEVDHVLVGHATHPPRPNAAEVGAHRYVSASQLARELVDQPESYTAWFRLLAPRLLTASDGAVRFTTEAPMSSDPHASASSHAGPPLRNPTELDYGELRDEDLELVVGGLARPMFVPPLLDTHPLRPDATPGAQ